MAVIPDPLGNPGVLGVRFANSLADGWPQGIDYGLGVTHRAVAMVAGGVPYGLRSVQLPHARLAPESVYRDHFGAETVSIRLGRTIQLGRIEATGEPSSH